MKRILGIWLPNWPIQRRVVAQPDLKFQPFILFRRDARRGQLVAACSPTAKQLGVRVDQPLSEACSLAQVSLQKLPASNSRLPASRLVIEPHDPDADLAQLKSLAESCDQFSPVVGLEQSDQPSTIFLDVTRLDHLFGGYESLAHQVATHFQTLGYYAHICIAENTAAAWGLTHHAPYEISTSPQPEGTLQRNSTRHQEKLDSQNDSQQHSAQQARPTSALRLPTSAFPTPFVHDTQHNFPWQQLPVAALRLEDETHSTLQQLGITRIAQLLQLPRTSLSSRLGHTLLKRLDQISGELDEPIVAHHPQPEFEAFQFIEHPTRRHDTIDFVVQTLTEEIGQKLAQQQRGALKVICKFRCEGSCEGNRHKIIRIGLFQPTAISAHLIELLRMQLEQTTIPAPVEYITLQVTLSAPLVQQQRQLFEQSVQQDWQQLSQLVNRLSSRLGPESVLRPVLQSSAQPEHSVRYQKMTGQLTTQSLKRTASQRKRKQPPSPSGLRPPISNFALPFQRPLVLHKTPIKLETIAVATDADGTQPPATFQYHNQQHHIASHFGPERIETGWWRAPIALRDYYRIETETGNRFWIYKNLRDQRWYLHGEF